MKRLLLVLAAALTLLATSCGSSGSSGESAAAATVNGSTITMDTLNQELQGLSLALYGPSDQMTPDEWAKVHGEGKSDTTYTNLFTASVLQSLVSTQLVEDELAARGITITDAQLTAAGQSLDQSIQQQEQQGQTFGVFSDSYRAVLVQRSAEQTALSDALKAETTTPTFTDEEVRAAYDANIDSLVAQNGNYACIDLILISWDENANPDAQISAPTPAEDAAALARANDAVAEINGGTDFGQVAVEKSAAPDAATSNGKYGCISEAQAQSGAGVKELTDAAFNQAVGVVGAPVRSDYGYLIVKVTSRGTPPFDDFASTMRAQLEKQAASADPLTAWFQDQSKDLKVWVNPQIGSWSDTAGVVPPEGASTQTTVGAGGPLSADTPLDTSAVTSQDG